MWQRLTHMRLLANSKESYIRSPPAADLEGMMTTSKTETFGGLGPPLANAHQPLKYGHVEGPTGRKR